MCKQTLGWKGHDLGSEGICCHDLGLEDVLLIWVLKGEVLTPRILLQIKLVNINSTDIVDGRPSIVLGLVWTIILYFQVPDSARHRVG